MDMVSQFADIQIDCIKSDKMVADYMPPLDKKKMELWWAERANEVASEPPSRHIIFMEENGEATGVVMLALNTTETGRFRGQVQKLIVSPKHRRKGIARIMMAMVEKVATADGRTMLVCSFSCNTRPESLAAGEQRLMRPKLLDTEKASPADKMYPKWGYQQVSHALICTIDDVNGTFRLLMGSAVWFHTGL